MTSRLACFLQRRSHGTTSISFGSQVSVEERIEELTKVVLVIILFATLGWLSSA